MARCSLFVAESAVKHK